jgi:hypothetical protein
MLPMVPAPAGTPVEIGDDVGLGEDVRPNDGVGLGDDRSWTTTNTPAARTTHAARPT